MTTQGTRRKEFIFAGLLIAATATPVLAQEYHSEVGDYPFRRSYLTGRAICIPPYDRAFPVRVYTTPPQQPYYNVPPYPVVAPY